MRLYTETTAFTAAVSLCPKGHLFRTVRGKADESGGIEAGVIREFYEMLSSRKTVRIRVWTGGFSHLDRGRRDVDQDVEGDAEDD